jgi:hypothetical protein
VQVPTGPGSGVRGRFEMLHQARLPGRSGLRLDSF